MPLPPSLTLITLTGKFVRGDGTAEAGYISFQSPGPLVSSSDNTIIAEMQFTATLTAAGTFSIVLPSTNDPDWRPVNWTWQVTQQLRVGGAATYSISLPHDTPGGTIDLADIIPVPESGGSGGTGTGVLTVNGDPGPNVVLDASDVGAAPTVHTHDGDAIVSGLVAFGRLPTGTSGTTVAIGNHTHGGGAVLSVNGETGTVVLNATNTPPASIGAVPATRQIISGTGMSGGGDLTADRTLTVTYGTSSGTATQGNDTRVVNALQATVVDAKGDLLAATAADTVARLAVGTNGQLLKANSATGTGLEWATGVDASEVVSGTLAVARGGTGIASYTTNNYVRASGATTLEQRTPAQVLSDIAGAAATHTHAAADTTSGTFANARIPLAPTVTTLTDAATIATDASLGNHFRITLAGNRTLGAPTNPTDGQRAVWEFIQDATGSRTLTLNAIFALGTDISGVTLTTTASKRDFMGCIYNSTAAKWFVVAFVKGY